LLHTLFWILLPLALLGDARVFLFVMNRIVFGDHQHEESPGRWLIYVLPPVLVALTVLWWPLQSWLEWLFSHGAVDRLTPEALERVIASANVEKIGAVWLLTAAGIGLYWLIDRTRVILMARQEPGTLTLESTVIPLRKAHIPFAWVRKLGGHNDVYDIEITRHEVTVEGLPEQFDGYRIVFLTDTHVAAFMRRRFYREIVKQVTIVDPDLVLLGGDFVSFTRHIPLLVPALLEGLTARDGVFSVLGNHDYWAGGEQVRTLMESHGVTFIINRSVKLQRDGAELTLLGVDEVYRGEPDPDAAFAGVDPNAPVLGVSHHPDIVDMLNGRRIDLLLCGHTHGGQIRFPFFGAPVVPSKHEQRYAAGFVRARRVLLYISRGIGAIPPLRILCKPEVATFTLRKIQS
jgi:predicted MPP superfamily phosphohydrolase